MNSRKLACLLGAASLGLASQAYADAYALTVFDIPGAYYTTINGINNHNVFTGAYSFDGVVDHGYVQVPGQLTTPVDDPKTSGINGTVANGIDDNGDVVGIYYNDPSTIHGANAAFTLIIGKGYQDWASGVNPSANAITNDGQVFGTIESPTPSHNAIIYEAHLDYGNNTFLDYPAPGEVDPTVQTYGGPAGTFGLGMNTYGAMVGSYWAYSPGSTAGVERGFSYTSNGFSVIAPLGAIQSAATGINDSGVITGWYSTKDAMGHTIFDGFVDVNGQYDVIAMPGADVTVVTGINNAGDIVGYFRETGGARQGFLGTPQFTLPATGLVRGPFGGFPASAPEPATWVMLITGLALAGGALRRARPRTSSSSSTIT